MAELSIYEMCKPLIEAKDDAAYAAASKEFVAKYGDNINSNPGKNVSGVSGLFDYAKHIKDLSMIKDATKLSDIVTLVGSIAQGNTAQKALESAISSTSGLGDILKAQEYGDDATKEAAKIATDGFAGLDATKFTLGADGIAESGSKANTKCSAAMPLVADKTSGSEKDGCDTAKQVQNFVKNNADALGLTVDQVKAISSSSVHTVGELLNGLKGANDTVTKAIQDFFTKSAKESDTLVEDTAEFLGVSKDDLLKVAKASGGKFTAEGDLKGKTLVEALIFKGAESIKSHKLIETIAKNFKQGPDSNIFETSSDTITGFKSGIDDDKKAPYNKLHEKVCGDSKDIFKAITDKSTKTEKCHADLNAIAYTTLSQTNCGSDKLDKDNVKQDCYNEIVGDTPLKGYYGVMKSAQDDGIDINASFDLS